MTEEQEYWRRLIAELQKVMTIAAIAEAAGVEDRQVWRWKAGERVPRGLQAIVVYKLHVERCPNRQGLSGHVLKLEVSVPS